MVQLTLSRLLPLTPLARVRHRQPAITFVGALGVVAGVIELLTLDGVLVPIALVAVTVKV